MSKDRHREGYHRDWAKTEKGKAKSRRQTEKIAAERKAKRDKLIAEGYVCKICGGVRTQRTIVGDSLNIHQNCNPSAWTIEARRLKRKK